VCATLWFFQHWASNLLAGLVGAIGALIGALIGGILAYKGALAGAQKASSTAFEVQEKEFANRDKAAKLADQALIRGVVQSISDEIEALWRQYYKEIGPHLSSVIPPEVARPFPVNQSYFVIFDASGALVGRIPSTSLRSKILDFYFGAKAMVDSLQYYARLSAYYFALGQGHPNSAQTWNEMLFYSGQLKAAHSELERLYKEVRPELDKYLNTTPSEQIVFPSSILP
jgi:gamma-glutamyltranspeptidase